MVKRYISILENRARGLLQDFVLKTNSLPPFNKLYLLIYKFVLRCTISALSPIKEIKSIYLEEKIDTGTYTFGSSDIDLAIVIDGCNFSEQRVLKKLEKIRRLFSMISSTLYTERQFKNDYMLNPNRIIKRKAPKLLKGEDILKELPILKDRNLIIRNFLGSCFLEFYDLGEWVFLKELSLHERRTCLNIFAKLIRNSCYARELLEFKKPYTKQEVCRIALKNTGAEFIPYEVQEYMQSNRYRNFATLNEEERYARIYSKAVFYLDKISSEWLKKDESIKTDNSSLFQITSELFPQETLGQARFEAKGFMDALPAEFLGYFTSIVLTSLPNTNYFYGVYMILKEDIPENNLFTFMNWLCQNFKAYFRTVKNTYFRPIFPLIMTKNSFGYFDGYGIAHIKLPLEYFFLNRHAEVMYGKEIKDIIKRPCDATLYKNMLSYAAELTKKAMFKIEPKRKSYNPPARYLVDSICGIFPSIRLFLDKKIIVTTPKEALIEYNRNYKNIEPLNEFYKHYNGSSIDKLRRNGEDIAKQAYPLVRGLVDEIDRILDESINYL